MALNPYTGSSTGLSDAVLYAPLGYPTLPDTDLVVGTLGSILSYNTPVSEGFNYEPTIAEVEYCAKLYALTMPEGRYWEAYNVPGTVDYALAMAVGEQLAIIFAYYIYLRRELNIDTTVDLIGEWEASADLPDPCTLQSSDTLETRRAVTKLFLSNKAFVTAGEFEQLVKDLTGYDVIVVPRGATENVYTMGLDAAMFDLAAFSSPEGNRFTFDVFVDYSLVGASGLDIAGLNEGLLDVYVAPPTQIECIINRVKPCNSIAVYHYDSDLYQAVVNGNNPYNP